MSSPDHSIQDVANSVGSKIFVVAISSFAGGRDLGPLLESLSLVHKLHPVDHLGHELHRVSLFKEVLSPRVPQLQQLLLPELVNHLLVSSSQIEGDLGATEPLLDGFLRSDILDILFQNFLLGPESLQVLEHLSQGSVHLSHLLALDTLVSPRVLGCIDLLKMLSVVLNGVLHDLLRDDQFLQHNLLHVLSPFLPGMSQVSLPGIIKELAALFNSISIDLLLSCIHADSLEDLPSEGLPGNGTNDVDRILLFIDVVAP